MSLLPVKTCTCTQDKKQAAGTDYDGQSLFSFRFPLKPSFGVSRSYGITLRRLRVNSSRVRTSNDEYVPVNNRHHTNWVDETRYRDKGYTHFIKNTAADFYCCWNFWPKIVRQCMRQSLLAMATISGTGLLIKAHQH